MPAQLSLTGEQLQQEIIERGYAEYEHNITDDAVEHLVEKYADFTLAHPDPLPSTMDAMLPAGDDPEILKYHLDVLDRSQDTQAEWHKYRTNVAQKFKPDGYTNRSFQERALLQARGVQIPPEDPKEYYHFTPGHWVKMYKNHERFDWGGIPPEVNQLHKAFAPIHRMATLLMERVCRDIEEVHPEISQFVTPQSLLNSPLRLLFYHPTPRPVLGGDHYDKGWLTLQLGESHQGLQVATGKTAPFEPVIRNSHTAAFFPGSVLAETIPDTVFQPAWHNIVATNRLNEDRFIPPSAVEVCGRWALIFFANGVGELNRDKAAMHTR